MRFGNQFRNELRTALLDSFPANLRDEFALVIEDANLTDGRRAYAYADFVDGVALYEMSIQKVVVWSEASDQLIKLLEAAIGRRPDAVKLRQLAVKLQPVSEPFHSVGFDLGKFERIVLKGVTFEHILEWIPRLIQARNAVCRFEPEEPKPSNSTTSDAGFGTGFLVAPDVVMTNDHNVRDYWNDNKKSRKIGVRFDCYRLPNGTIAPGRKHYLSPDWQILNSPSSELDFALIRLTTRAGDDIVDGQSRGFLELTPTSLTPTDPLFILQHPGIEEPLGSGIWRAQPMMLSFGSVDRVISATRVGYKVNTNPGSSGSPCLTQDLCAVAIHHYGTDNYNQAVLFQGIIAHLHSRRSELMAKGVFDLPSSSVSVAQTESTPESNNSARRELSLVDLSNEEILLIAEACLKEFARSPEPLQLSEIELQVGDRIFCAEVISEMLTKRDIARRLRHNLEMVSLHEVRIAFLRKQRERAIGVVWDMTPEIEEKEKERMNEIGHVRETLKFVVSKCWISIVT